MAVEVRILVADDHPVVRAGLKALLEQHQHFQVVAEAASGEEALAKAKEAQPDVAILDARLPGLSGIEACRQIVQSVEDCRVIMLTSYPEAEWLFAAIQAGAAGYVLKRIGVNELLRAIERVSSGEEMFDYTMTTTVLPEMRKASEPEDSTAFADLSFQQLAVLALLAQGLTNRQIGLKLYLGEGTVRNYVSTVLTKIRVSNRAEAAVYAVKHNIHQHIPPSASDDQ